MRKVTANALRQYQAELDQEGRATASHTMPGAPADTKGADEAYGKALESAPQDTGVAMPDAGLGFANEAEAGDGVKDRPAV